MLDSEKRELKELKDSFRMIINMFSTLNRDSREKHIKKLRKIRKSILVNGNDILEEWLIN